MSDERPLTTHVVAVNESLTHIAGVHIVLVFVGLVAAIGWQQLAALVLAGPSAFVLALAFADGRLPHVFVGASTDKNRLIEGDDVAIALALEADRPVARVEIELEPDDRLFSALPLRAALSLEADGPNGVMLNFTTTGWGMMRIGRLTVAARDRFGVRVRVVTHELEGPLRVHVAEPPLRTLSDPARFRQLVGSHHSDHLGVDGVELADVRPYRPGDRLRSLHWRISARKDEPWVTLRHPDRSTTVVLVIDGHVDEGWSRSDALRESVQGALALARLHLQAHDPVGLLLHGDGLRWVAPTVGTAHLHQLTDVLLELAEETWPDLPNDPRLADKLLPDNAVLLAFDRLDDEGSQPMLEALGSTGRSMHVIEPIVDWRTRREEHAGSDLAWRLLEIERAAHRQALANVGVVVSPWSEGQQLESVLTTMRRQPRLRGAVR